MIVSSPPEPMRVVVVTLERVIATAGASATLPPFAPIRASAVAESAAVAVSDDVACAGERYAVADLRGRRVGDECEGDGCPEPELPGRRDTLTRRQRLDGGRGRRSRL